MQPRPKEFAKRGGDAGKRTIRQTLRRAFEFFQKRDSAGQRGEIDMSFLGLVFGLAIVGGIMYYAYQHNIYKKAEGKWKSAEIEKTSDFSEAFFLPPTGWGRLNEKCGSKEAAKQDLKLKLMLYRDPFFALVSDWDVKASKSFMRSQLHYEPLTPEQGEIFYDVRCIGRRGNKLVDTVLLIGVQHHNFDVRTLSAEYLKKYGSKDALERAKRKLVAKLKSEGIHQWDLQVLDELGGSNAAFWALTDIASDKDREPGSRESAIDVLAPLGDKRAVSVLKRLMNDNDSNMRMAAMDALVHYFPDYARKALVKRMLKDKDENIRKKAEDYLHNLPDPARRKDPAYELEIEEEAAALKKAREFCEFSGGTPQYWDREKKKLLCW